MQTSEIRQIVVEVPITAPIEKVWKAMFEELPEWWPNDFLCFPGSRKIQFEPWAGGRLFEQAEDGREILWANVLMIHPGTIVDFVGYMMPSYGGPSITMYRFALSDAGDGTTLFRLSDSIMGRVDDEQVASLDEGWNYLFASLKRYAEESA